MLRPLAVAALAVLATPDAAGAADLARQSRLGAVFAEPAQRTARVELPIEEPIVRYAPEVDVPSVVHGYYGKPNSYYYRSYYGTAPELIFNRAPYGCGFYGYC